VSGARVKVLGLNATFNNISGISWWRCFMIWLRKADFQSISEIKYTRAEVDRLHN
jgi:hypothetical protein